MTYQCPKGHQSTDSDYCSECGALIGQSSMPAEEAVQVSSPSKSTVGGTGSKDICPDCGTPRTSDARFCEVCRHDFQENKTGVAEAIVASQQSAKPQDSKQQAVRQTDSAVQPAANATDKIGTASTSAQVPKAVVKEEIIVSEKLNIVISVDKDKVASCDIQTAIKPDTVDRVFPLDLDENLVGRRSTSRGIYPEIEINDPGVSHRHLKFIKQQDGSFAVLELGSANGTELNGAQLEPGVNTTVKAGDELSIGIWTLLKLVAR